MSRTPASGTPRAPRLANLAEPDRADLLAELDWLDVAVAHDLSSCDLGEVTMQGIRFLSAQLVATNLQRGRTIDAVFEGCDLSGARFDDGALTRVEFRGCRLSGAQFNAARMHDVRFTGCRLDGASFRMVHGERVWFEGSMLAEAEFCAAELIHSRFDHCDLTTADFSQARVADAPLHGSILEGVRGVTGLQRPIIDPAQVGPFAYSLMAIHGVVIANDDD